jgi:hypothetical protein
MRPRDVTGALIRAGDVVRIVGAPNLSKLHPRARRDSQPVFEHIAGTYKRVRAFNELGWLELSFRILDGPSAGLHTVWIEPELVRVRRARR